MIRHLLLGSVGLAAICLAAAHAWAGAWPWVGASLGLGILWLAGEGRGWSLAAPLGFGASVVLAALSLWLSADGFVAPLAVLAVIAALSAWDLDGLVQRLARFCYVGDLPRPEPQHVALDVAGRLLAQARALWRDAALLCITHDVGETLSFDHVLILDRGRVVEAGPPSELAARHGSRYRAMLNAETAVREGLWSGVGWRRLWLEQGRLLEGEP